MGESKVLSSYLGVPTRSCHDMCKYGFEHDSPTKARIPRPTRATLGKIPERKKVPGSTKLSSEIKSQPTCQVNGQEIPTSTKRAAAFVNHQSDFPSRSYQRRYSDIFIPERSSKLQESLLDGSSSRRNHSCKMEKDGGSSELSKKKSVVTSTISFSKIFCEEGSSTRQNVTTTQKQDIKPQRAGQVGLENEDCGPKVLKFKKGKTTDIQSDISSPKRKILGKSPYKISAKLKMVMVILEEKA
ncbi:hypothetical protein K7X08_031649 [Anisodus acutangulus]|uniref:Uncharacterized protein n=1 Tax=Anisodus acutangulus TaxID=402998 RepID=A0A9Q1MS34_9SOLA|nr:hypothetical protein K7X08_031649 [Anisodus acutangulus]